MQTQELHSLYLQSPKLNQLNILREVAANPHTTQAELANRCLLSVAMVNNYMKELSKSGWLEYHRKTTKSVTYHLTVSGVAHLESLQSDLIREMVEMFTAAKEQIRKRIMNQAQGDLQRVILLGTGPLAQLTFHALEVSGVSVVGICDADIEKIGSDFCGRQVVGPSQIRFIAPDAVIITEILSNELNLLLSSLVDRGMAVIRLDTHVSLNMADDTSTQPSPALMHNRENETASLLLPKETQF